MSTTNCGSRLSVYSDCCIGDSDSSYSSYDEEYSSCGGVHNINCNNTCLLPLNNGRAKEQEQQRKLQVVHQNMEIDERTSQRRRPNPNGRRKRSKKIPSSSRNQVNQDVSLNRYLSFLTLILLIQLTVVSIIGYQLPIENYTLIDNSWTMINGTVIAMSMAVFLIRLSYTFHFEGLKKMTDNRTAYNNNAFILCFLQTDFVLNIILGYMLWYRSESIFFNFLFCLIAGLSMILSTVVVCKLIRWMIGNVTCSMQKIMDTHNQKDICDVKFADALLGFAITATEVMMDE